MSRNNQTSWKTRLAMVAMLLASAPCASLAGDAPDGEQLLRGACTQCHGLAPISATRNGPGGWRQVVDKMTNWGAQIRTTAERDALVTYLVAKYGPGANPMTTTPMPQGAPLASADPAALPPGPGADQVRAYCSMCHDLGRVVGTQRSQTEWRRYTAAMLAKTGASFSQADIRLISDYLGRHFAAPEITEHNKR